MNVPLSKLIIIIIIPSLQCLPTAKPKTTTNHDDTTTVRKLFHVAIQFLDNPSGAIFFNIDISEFDILNRKNQVV